MDEQQIDVEPEVLAEWQYVFELFDRNNDGKVNQQEFLAAIRCIGQAPALLEINNLPNNLECDADGNIDFKEFSQFMSRQPILSESPNERKVAYKVFLGNKYELTAKEMKHMLTHVGDKMDADEVIELFKVNNVDVNGVVTDKNFLQMLEPKI